MKVLIDLTASEVAYIREFKRQQRANPLKERIRNVPSVAIFLKLAEVVK